MMKKAFPKFLVAIFLVSIFAVDTDARIFQRFSERRAKKVVVDKKAFPPNTPAAQMPANTGIQQVCGPEGCITVPVAPPTPSAAIQAIPAPTVAATPQNPLLASLDVISQAEGRLAKIEQSLLAARAELQQARLVSQRAAQKEAIKLATEVELVKLDHEIAVEDLSNKIEALKAVFEQPPTPSPTE